LLALEPGRTSLPVFCT